MAICKKISLIGAGNIGGTLAHLISLKQLGNVVLFDVVERMPQGKALDIAQSSGIENFNVKITGTNDIKEIESSDAIIITAGIPRKPGMSRDDLIKVNSEVITEMAKNIKTLAPSAFVIVITNPLDAMAFVMQKVTNFPSNRIVGMAGVLDSARFRYFLSQELKVSVEDVSTFVLGGHGDTMIPLSRYTKIAGITVEEMISMGMLSQKKLDAIIDRTRNGGAEIVQLLKCGSAFYSPASSAIQMLESYLKDEKRVLPCAVNINGKYGVNEDIYVGVPVIIGKNGVEKIIELDLTHLETNMFNDSLDKVRDLLSSLDKNK